MIFIFGPVMVLIVWMIPMFNFYRPTCGLSSQYNDVIYKLLLALLLNWPPYMSLRSMITPAWDPSAQ